jgi:hypothetical protein
MAGSVNDRQRFNELLKNSDEFELSGVVIDIPELMQGRAQTLGVGNEQREAWLKLVSFNEHGMDGDLALKAFKKASNVPGSPLVRLSNVVAKGLEPSVKCVAVLNGCTRFEDFCALLEQMSALIRDVSVAGVFYPTELPSSKKMQTVLADLRGMENWLVVKGLTGLRDEVDVVTRFQLINKIDNAILNKIVEAFGLWSVFYNHVMPRLESQNKQWGGDILKQSQNSIANLLDDLLTTVNDLQEASNESA